MAGGGVDGGAAPLSLFVVVVVASLLLLLRHEVPVVASPCHRELSRCKSCHSSATVNVVAQRCWK